MPIFTYKCERCAYKFDILCKYEDFLQPCPQCEPEHVLTKRQLSAPKFNMKKGPYDSYL